MALASFVHIECVVFFVALQGLRPAPHHVLRSDPRSAKSHDVESADHKLKMLQHLASLSHEVLMLVLLLTVLTPSWSHTGAIL